jgi:alkylation response protein AidB-like acyl-CoA dehydrogenase
MDFALSARAEDVCGRMWDFMRESVFPAEPVYDEWRAARGHDNHEHPPVLDELKLEARKRGLWNLFHHELGGLSNLEYASVAEIMGWSPAIAPEATNCGAPDTGNMETLMLFGTPEQKQRWLEPLLEGEIRSGFAMTEPDVASSDARNIQTSIVRSWARPTPTARRTASSRWCWSPATPRAWRSSATCRCSGTRTSTGTASCASPTSASRCRTSSPARATAS